MGQLVADRLVEVLARHDADEPLVLEDEDPALAVPLTDGHRARDRLVRADRARRARHDLARSDGLARRLRERLAHACERLVERALERRRGRTGVASAAQSLGERARVELGRLRAGDAEDAAAHLDQADERAGLGQVDELVGEGGDAHVGRLGGGRGDDDLGAGDLLGRERVEQGREQLALLGGEGRVEVAAHLLLAGAMVEAPGQRVGVSARGRGVRERARVLVDAEREDGRLERRDGDLPLGEHPDERGRQSRVLREHGLLRRDPAGQLVAVVVEDDLLDLRVERDRLELAEPRRVHRLDDDEPLDRAQVEAGRLADVEFVGVQTVELAHVPRERAGQRRDGALVEPAHGEERRERVEVGVRVRGDDGLGPHGPHSASGRSGQSGV